MKQYLKLSTTAPKEVFEENFQVPLVCAGCDFRIAPTSWRERLYLEGEDKENFFKKLRSMDEECGFVTLVTCNRSEWIVSTKYPHWMGGFLESEINYFWKGMESCGIKSLPKPYVYTGRDAARHIFRVIAGFESFIRGERQIARQFHIAVKKSRDEGMTTSVINGLENVAGRMEKRLKQKGISMRQSIGIHSLVCKYIDGNFGLRKEEKGKKRKIAVVGMGEIGRKVAGILEHSNQWKVFKVNRTVRSIDWVSLENLEELFPFIEGMILCTGADRPILKLSKIKGKVHKSFWIVDIGVPRQIERDLSERDKNIRVIGLDELLEGYGSSLPRKITMEIEKEIEASLRSFEIFCRERPMAAFLDSVQKIHKKYIKEKIPEIVRKDGVDFDSGLRKKIVRLVREILIQYTSQIVEKFHFHIGERKD